MVIESGSTLAKVGNDLTAQACGEIVDWSKAEALPLVCTSLLDE